MHRRHLQFLTLVPLKEFPMRKLGSMGTSRMGSKHFSNYFPKNHKPLVSVFGLPPSVRVSLLITILKGTRADAETIARGYHLEEGSLDMIVKRSIYGFIENSRKQGLIDVEHYLRPVIGTAERFGFSEERDAVVRELCIRLKDEGQSDRAAFLAVRELPREKFEKLFTEWIQSPERTSRCLEKYMKESGRE